MFRRSSKLTAMLIAAAAVVSVVPANAAERLGTKDGNITKAVAFDGGYVYDGYRTDNDDAALYYNNGSKDVNVDKNEDYDSYELNKYGTKYATVKDGNEDYLLDLSNGKIDDEESVQDKIDNAKNKLKSKINKEDRYSNFKNSASSTFADNNFTQILGDKYGEVWYQYAANGDGDVSKRMSTTATAVNNGIQGYVGFTNDSGNYIDVSQTANMYIYLPALVVDSSKGKTVKFEDYGDDNYGVTVKLDKVTPVAQDKDSIYAVAQVTVSSKDNNTVAINGVQTTQYFFQKISKSQGDKKDGAYLPKDVTSYQLDTSKIYDNGDMKDATNALLSYVNKTATDSDGRKVVNVEVKDNTIYATSVATDKVKIWKLKFKKDKVDAQPAASEAKNEKVDSYVVKKDGDGDHDIVNGAYSIDSDGNTWVLDKGKIIKADGTSFKDVYTVDRSIEHLDVYDENNLIAWADEDVYTTVSEGKKQTEQDAGVDTDKKDDTAVVVKAGWEKNADGTWAFYKEGVKATGWLNDKGTWYFLDGTGTMKTGWINDKGTWYYCNASGAMQTGWLLDGTTWYYLNANGSMAANTTVDGYVLGANGAWIK